MTEKFDPEKIQKEFLEALRKMALQERPSREPETDTSGETTEVRPKKKRQEIFKFDLRPKQVKKHLDRFVIRQEEAKRVLATAICDHYHHVRQCLEGAKCANYAKQNILMLGPTGVGKTYLVRCLADLVGVPFVKADATKFSETGYVGGDVDDLVRELVHRADGDIELAQYGMIYLDEVDKIASTFNIQGRDVSGAGVQRGLLKIMEETEVLLRNPQDIQSQFQAVMEFQQKGKVSRPVINTRHILFIVSGAFEKLPQLVEKRLKAAHPIGFSPLPVEKMDPLKLFYQVRTEDFVNFGLEPEFIGRLPVRVVCEALNEEDLYQILTASEESILKQYLASFAAYGITLRFDDKALWEIAKLAAEEKTGARGLMTVCERIFRDLKYELPSSSVKDFTLTVEMVHEPAQALEALIEKDRHEHRQRIVEEIHRFEQAFEAKSGLRICFDDHAINALVARILQQECETIPFLEKLLSNYHYGLGLIHKKRPQSEYRLSEAVVQSPNTVLDEWIREAYETKD